MRKTKIISIMLMCTLVFNMLFTFTAFATEDITGDVTEFPVNVNTVSNTDITDPTLITSNTTLVSWGAYFEYEITTQTAGDYMLTLYTATNGYSASFDVSVNGTKAISSYAIPNAGSWTPVAYEMGVISLNTDTNTLKFKSSNNSHTCVHKFTLTKVEKDDITGNVTDFPVNKNTIAATDITDASLVTSNSVLVSWGAYFDYTIETKQEGNYILTLYAGTDLRDATFDVSVNSTKPIAGFVIPDANSYNSAPYEMGVIRLKEGTNTLKFKSSSASHAVIYKFTLTKCEEDIRSNPATFAVNNNTISNTDVGTGEQLTYAILISYGKYFEYSIRTEKAANYELSVNAGTPNNNCELDIFVNDVEAISNMAIPNSGSYTGVKYEAGKIRLRPGTNTLKFVAGGSTHACVYDFTLTKSTEDITNDPMTFAVNKNTIASTDITDESLVTAGSVLVSFGAYFDYTVTTQSTANYMLTLYAGTDYSSAEFDVLINGIEVISNYVIPDANSYTSVPYEMGVIRLNPGTNTIRFLSSNKSHANIYKFTLTRDDTIKITADRLEIQNENGVRPTFVINGGEDVYAVTNLIKFDADYNDELWLLIAQYDVNNKLTEAVYTPISTSDMPISQAQEFKTKITLGENSTTVKGFLMKADDLTPVIENIGFAEATIFNDDILNEGAPNVTPASEVSNGKGGYYTGYDINDGTYNIDAIFYDSEVGNQTKVFAYMGVPKTDKNGNTVTASNKVPAVVLVHGGAGYAFKEWVKKWNDKGVAAIAMSLTGDGPDATGANTAIHPYAGQWCWDDNGKAFLKNFENAAMYQNVLNVIRAHNLIRSLDTVDANNTAITGISWGGITTTTVIGVDNRFKFAIPCYGTGYLDQSRTYFKTAYAKSDRSANWDPANFAANAQMPVLYVNGDSDEHFSVNITTLTSDVTPSSKISVHHKLVHGYDPIWNMEMIYKYATNMFNNIDPLADISNESADGGVFTFDYSAPQGTTVSNAVMYYITSDDLGYGGNVDWKSVSAYTNANSQISFTIPEGATHLYASVTDNNGYTVSTRYISVN